MYFSRVVAIGSGSSVSSKKPSVSSSQLGLPACIACAILLISNYLIKLPGSTDASAKFSALITFPRYIHGDTHIPTF